MSTINEPASGGTVNGTADNDTFVANGVNATFNGDGGVDTVSFVNATSAVNVNLALGTATGWGTYTLNGIDNIYGGWNGGTLTGGANTTYIAAPGGPTTLNAGSADCTMVGGTGNDIFNGGAGNDDIIAGTGNNTIDGGGGYNTVDYVNETGFVTVDLYAGAWHPGGQDTLKNISNVIGGNYGNILAANYQYAMSMEGGTGNDIFLPRDAGSGGAPAQGAGITLTGDGGADTYVLTPSLGNVTITDFSAVAGDRLDLASFGSLHSLSDVLAVTSQSGSDSVITLGSGEVVLKGVAPSALTAADFLFSTTDDFLGTGASQVLTQSANGAVDVGAMNTSNQVSLSQVGSLGAEWKFDGTGDYLGDGRSQFLIQNTSGFMAVGDVSGGQTTYTAASGLGPEWKIIGSGNLLGDGKDQFLIQNTNGAFAVGEVNSGSGGVNFSAAGGLGSEWTFGGVGDFLGDGKAQFLADNSKTGAVYVGEVGAGGQVTYTQIGALGSGWTFEEVGNFLGGQKDQFLIENASGGLSVGQAGANNQLTFTNIGGLGSDWKFVGEGDYNGYGVSDFLIQNGSGAVYTGSVQNGAAVYTPVSGLSSGMTVHG